MSNIQDKFRTYINEQTPVDWTPNWKDIPACYLYDFFDSIHILVTLYHFDMGEFVPLINMYENYTPETTPIAEEGHIEIVFDGQHEGLIFDTRKEAEIVAFEKAFELAETINN